VVGLVGAAVGAGVDVDGRGAVALGWAAGDGLAVGAQLTATTANIAAPSRPSIDEG
jgi:hypothetical protein